MGPGVRNKVDNLFAADERWLETRARYLDGGGIAQVVAVVVFPKVKVVHAQNAQDDQDNGPGQVTPLFIDRQRYQAKEPHGADDVREVLQLGNVVRFNVLHANVVVEDVDVLQGARAAAADFVNVDVHLHAIRILWRVQNDLPHREDKEGHKRNNTQQHKKPRKLFHGNVSIGVRSRSPAPW